MPCARGVEVPGRARQPYGLVDDGREEPCARRAPARAHGADVRAGARQPARERMDGQARTRRAALARRAPRRRASHDVFLLPSAAPGGGASGAGVEHSVRLRRARNRERFLVHARRDGEAHPARKEAAGYDENAVRARRGGGVSGTARGGPACALPPLQRGLPRRRRRRGPDRTLRRGDAARRDAARPSASGDSDDARARGADVFSRRARPGASRRRRRSDPARRARPRAGTNGWSARAGACSISRRPARSSAIITSKRPSPRCMPTLRS